MTPLATTSLWLKHKAAVITPLSACVKVRSVAKD